MSRIDRLLRGPYARLPRPVDAAGEWWAGRRPRIRMLLGALVTVAVLLGIDARVRAVDARWGGAPLPVVVTTADRLAGDRVGTVRHLRLPPAAVPPDALADVESRQVLALPAPEGTILTADHVDPRGPTAALPAGRRAIPVPVEPGWGISAGGWVDVWVLGTGDTPARQVASGRPVVAVHDDSSGLTALLGLTPAEAEQVTTGLALGRVLLAHAPGPD